MHTKAIKTKAIFNCIESHLLECTHQEILIDDLDTALNNSNNTKIIRSQMLIAIYNKIENANVNLTYTKTKHPELDIS